MNQTASHELIKKVRQFLADNKIDYLLVNATNEFLVEYSPLNENSRYFLTNFSGSTGDALLSKDKIALFVDGRYHQQADQEVDKDAVKVVKMKLSQTFAECLEKEVKKNKTLAIVAKKNSQGRFEIIKSAMDKKCVDVILLDSDPVMNFLKPETEEKSSKIESIKEDITGRSADKKFEEIAKTLNPKEAILITNLEEGSYLCNLRNFSQNYSSKIEAKCLVKKDKAILFTDMELRPFSKNFAIKKLHEFKNFIGASDDSATIFIDKLSITAYDYNILGNKAAYAEKNIIKEMKSIKTEEEIAHLKTCFERADKALLATREYIESNKNLSEWDITKNLEDNFYKSGAKSLSFKSIVAKDKNSALAHYSNNSKTEILEDGSLVLIDCGAYYEGGYATDATRVFVKGTPSEWQKKVYTTVLKGFLAAFNKKITPNTSGYVLDKTARKILNEFVEKIGLKGFAFSHSLGHGIGISVHENPPSLACSPLAKTALKPNMCFTIEPGLYNSDFGGVRLENSCYLKHDNGILTVESFSKMCFEEKLIDFSLLNAREKRWLKEFELR